MIRILRGEIYHANLNPVQGHEQGGVRPILVISHDVFNERSGTVIAMAIMSQAQRAGYPITYRLPTDLLPGDSWVKISQVRTISTERLRDRLSSLAEADVDHIVSGLVQLVG